MYYKKEYNTLNFLIEVIIEVNNKLYKVAIEIFYSNLNNKVKLYYEYTSYYSKKPKTNKQSNNEYKTMSIKFDLFWQYKTINPKKKKGKKIYIYDKLGYFAKDFHLNNIVKQKQIKAIPKNDAKL